MPDQKWMSVHGCNYNWYMLWLEKRISLFYINQLTRWHFTRINVLWVIVFHKSCLCSAKEPLDSFQPSGSWWHLRSHNSAWLYENNYSRIKVIKVLNILHAAGGGCSGTLKKRNTCLWTKSHFGIKETYQAFWFPLDLWNPTDVLQMDYEDYFFPSS